MSYLQATKSTSNNNQHKPTIVTDNKYHKCDFLLQSIMNEHYECYKKVLSMPYEINLDDYLWTQDYIRKKNMISSDFYNVIYQFQKNNVYLPWIFNLE